MSHCYRTFFRLKKFLKRWCLSGKSWIHHRLHLTSGRIWQEIVIPVCFISLSCNRLFHFIQNNTLDSVSLLQIYSGVVFFTADHNLVSWISNYWAMPLSRNGFNVRKMDVSSCLAESNKYYLRFKVSLYDGLCDNLMIMFWDIAHSTFIFLRLCW